MINLSTKFEVSISTHYEEMKGKAKCRKWDGFGQLVVTQGHWQPNHSIKFIRLSIRLSYKLRMFIQGAAKNSPLQKSHYFQNNLIFFVNFSEIIRETFCH